MTLDKLDMIYNDIQELKEDVKELKNFKNKVIGGGVVLSAMFAFVFDCIKNIFRG